MPRNRSAGSTNWAIDVPIGSLPRLKAAHRKALAYKHDVSFAAVGLRDYLKELQDDVAWQNLRDRKGALFSAWEDYCQYPEPLGLGMKTVEAAAILAEPDGSSRTIAVVLGKHGGDRVSERVIRGSLDRKPAAEMPRRVRTLARLRRDDPEMAERVEAGELTANAAAEPRAGASRPTPTNSSAAGGRRPAKSSV